MFLDRIDMVADESCRILHIILPPLMLYDYNELYVGILKNLRCSLCGIRFIYIERHNGSDMLFNGTEAVNGPQF